MSVRPSEDVEELVEDDTAHLRPGDEHGGEGGPLVSDGVVGHQLLHVSPTVGAAAHYVDQTLVGHDAHTESWLLHGALHPPLVEGGVVHLNAAPDVLPHPPTKGVEAAVESDESKLAPGDHHVCYGEPAVVLGVVDLTISQDLAVHLSPAHEYLP